MSNTATIKLTTIEKFVNFMTAGRLLEEKKADLERERKLAALKDNMKNWGAAWRAMEAEKRERAHRKELAWSVYLSLQTNAGLNDVDDMTLVTRAFVAVDTFEEYAEKKLNAEAEAAKANAEGKQ